MGNSFSVLPDDENSSSDIRKKIDDIAMNYILTQNSLDLIRFSDREYYDNVVILTANILKSNLNNVELGILNDRVQFGDNINGNNKLFIKSANQIKELTIKNDKIKEKVLHYISKFYVKIMTIFSAIVATIDPKYINEGDGNIFSLKDFDDYKYIEGETNSIKLYSLMNPMGLIMKRLNILKNKMTQSNEDGTGLEYVTINPGEKFCKMNETSVEEGGYGGKMTLQNEIGIKELDRLYYDIYDYDDKAWTKKSEKMEEAYNRDLDKFYTIFTGNEERPDYVNSFKDIELLEYHKLVRCRNEEYFKDIILSRDDPLLIKYTKKIDEIHNLVYKKKQELLFVLKSLFLVQEVSTENGVESKTILNPDLNLEALKKIQEKVKDLILDMYIHCEYCFIQALMIYELIYNEKYGELSEEDINNIPDDDSNIKADVRQIIGNPSITNNDNILPAADDGIDNENGENKILAMGNAAAPALISQSPVTEEMREIETGNSSLNVNQQNMMLESNNIVEPSDELNNDIQIPPIENEQMSEEQILNQSNTNSNTNANANTNANTNVNKPKLLSFSSKPTPQFILNNNANKNSQGPLNESIESKQQISYSNQNQNQNNSNSNGEKDLPVPEQKLDLQQNNGIQEVKESNVPEEENKSFIQKLTGFFSKKPTSENENANKNNDNVIVASNNTTVEPEEDVNVEEDMNPLNNEQELQNENQNTLDIPTNSLPEPSISDVQNRNGMNTTMPEKESRNGLENAAPGFKY